MSKEFEALEIVDKMANYILLDEEYGFIDDEEKQAIIKDRDTIKQALIKAQEQEKVFDDKLSFKDGSITCGFDYKGKQIIAMPSEEYNKFMEQEKVLEILFKKQVDLGWLWYCIHECVNSLNEYNKKMPIEKFKLTQEEFDLLKRYFNER